MASAQCLGRFHCHCGSVVRAWHGICVFSQSFETALVGAVTWGTLKTEAYPVQPVDDVHDLLRMLVVIKHIENHEFIAEDRELHMSSGASEQSHLGNSMCHVDCRASKQS